jgi:GNAT superfamily N-acetyltransferase
MTDFRSATIADLPEIHRIWWAADPFDAFNDNPWFGHVLRTGSMMVATIDVRPIGFAGVRQVGGTTVVSDCFVLPDHQGLGVGTELLSRLVPLDRPVMTLASSDPKARALYTRFGMAGQWDCHYLEGDPGGVERVMGQVLEAGGYPVEESDLSHLRDDLRCRFLEVGGGHAAVAADEVESSVVTPAGDPFGMLAAVFGWAADRGDHRVKLHLSDRHPAFPRLIEAGFVVTGADTLMASPRAQVPDPTRVTFNGDILRLHVSR